MAEIYPFTAVLYQAKKGVDITPFVAPPYDVIDMQVRAALSRRDSHNIVQIILPEDPAGGDRYRAAAGYFQAWYEKGVFVSLEPKALYVWEQTFTYGGVEYTRRALVAKVGCRPYQRGGVMRHELTHRGPKEDRLRLYQATRAQFSQMFGIFKDDDGRVSAHLAKAATTKPLRTAAGDDGHTSRLFSIMDPALIRELQAILDPQTITMADGHHRYETAVAYYEQAGRAGHTLMVLVPSSDAGLLVLPTHRTVKLPPLEGGLETVLFPEFTVEAFPFKEWPALYGAAADAPERGLIVAVAPEQEKAYRIGWKPGLETVTLPARRAGMLGDVGVLHEGVFSKIAAAASLNQPDSLGYLHEAEEAVRVARARGEWAFLLRPTPVEGLMQVADEQEVMPQKSTYFYPKFLSGFVNARLD